MTEEADTSPMDEVERLRRRLGPLAPQQIQAWRQMGPIGRLALVDQAFHLALEIVRVSERRRHPDLCEEELAWRVIRRLHGNPRLGR